MDPTRTNLYEVKDSPEVREIPGVDLDSVHFVFRGCVRGKDHPFDSSTSIVAQIEYKLESLYSMQQENVIIDS